MIIYKAEDLSWFSAFFLFRSFFTCFFILIIVKKHPKKNIQIYTFNTKIALKLHKNIYFCKYNSSLI